MNEDMKGFIKSYHNYADNFSDYEYKEYEREEKYFQDLKKTAEDYLGETVVPDHEEQRVGEVWYLYSEDLGVYVRFERIPMKKIGNTPVPAIRIQWTDERLENWRIWDTDYAKAECPIWNARKIFRHIQSNNYVLVSSPNFPE